MDHNNASPVDLNLPVGTAATAVPAAASAAGGTPQALWAVAGAGLALVVGLAATAAVTGRQGAEAEPGYAAPTATAPAANADRQAARPSRGSPAQRLAAAEQQGQAPAAAPCAHCGVVESVQAVKVRGRANGTGAVIGGVAGGVIGHEIGGNTTGTVLGAVGGGFLGHHIEKEARSHTAYRTQVRMDDGSLRSFTEGSSRAIGSRVTVDNGKLKAAPAP